jgi:hypothetical protein
MIFEISREQNKNRSVSFTLSSIGKILEMSIPPLKPFGRAVLHDSLGNDYQEKS